MASYPLLHADGGEIGHGPLLALSGHAAVRWAKSVAKGKEDVARASNAASSGHPRRQAWAHLVHAAPFRATPMSQRANPSTANQDGCGSPI